jgi:hypothetical protein
MVLWDAWKAYAHRAGSYQTRVLLSIVYLVVLGPAALVTRALGTRLLDLRNEPGLSTWIARGAQERSLEAMRRQW